MADDAGFRSDLFRGTAADYDRFRLGYPESMLEDLVGRAGVRGDGLLLDLACGTGQVAFALAGEFREVWAVDQEPGMVAFVREKAAAAGVSAIRAVAADAEVFAPDATFELVAIGNAFHRLRRDEAARTVFRLLEPRGHLGLLWSGSPWLGDEAWQVAFSRVLDRWEAAVSAGRIPDDWDERRRRRPDRVVLAGAGFEYLGAFHFSSGHAWTPDELIGFVYSTSFLSRLVLGSRASEFEADMHRALDPFDLGAGLHQLVDFSYELYARPAV